MTEKPNVDNNVENELSQEWYSALKKSVEAAIPQERRNFLKANPAWENQLKNREAKERTLLGRIRERIATWKTHLSAERALKKIARRL
jgi:hypothetical protein